MLDMYLPRCREWLRVAFVTIASLFVFMAAAGRVEALDTAASAAVPSGTELGSADGIALGKPPSRDGAPANLVVAALSRFVVKAVWEDKSSDETSFSVYRGTSSGSYDTRKSLPANSVVYYDTAVTAGAAYFYKVCNGVGCTAEVNVTVPTAVDTTLSLLPSFVTTWPEGFANAIDSRAQLAITLQPEDPGVDLTGSTVELFVDEPTQEEGLSTGEASIHEPGLGRDEVACLSRAPVPARAVTVGAPGPFTLTVGDLRAGQHAFRVRITDTLGTTRERAFLRHVLRPDAVYGDLVWVGSGNVTKSKRPVLFGYGPPSRFSPDCQDLDDRYYTVVYYQVTDKQGTVWIRAEKAYTDSAGLWSFTPAEDLPTSTAADGSTAISVTLYAGYMQANAVTLGRDIPLAAGGSWSMKQGAQGNIGGAHPYQTVTLTYVRGRDAAPYLDPDSVPSSIVIESTAPVATGRLRFRLLDDFQNLDPTTPAVTNQTLGGQPVAAYLSANQTGPTSDKNNAWWTVDLPFATGPNQLLVTARDRAGKTLSQTISVTRSTPNVIARIAAPLAADYRRHAIVPLDASASEGAAGMEVRWAFFGRTWNGSSVSRVALPSMEQSTATGTFVMPSYDSGVVVRLVVATPGHLPADLYTSGLPCSIFAGTPDCDATEVALTNACGPSVWHPCYGDSSTQFTVEMLSPVDGATLPFDQPVHLEAVAGDAVADFLYRWWIAPASALSERTLLSPQTPDSTGFAAGYAELDVDPVALGLSPGDYEITVEAGIDKTGCVGLIRSASSAIRLGHELSGVAPGQALPGGTVRVYGSTFVPGAAVTVLVDPTPLDAADRRTFSLTPDEERAVSLQLPADLAPNLYYLAATDPAGNGISVWKQALEVVAPTATVANEEDPSCGGAGTECAHPIAFGQVVTANWGEAGDIDTFYLTVGEGTTLDVSVERLDASLPVLHPDAVDPEVFIVDPDGIVDGERGYANDASADDTNAHITGYVAPKSGLYLLACRSLKGVGNYRVRLAKTSHRAPTDFETIPYGARAINVIPAAGEASTVTFQAMVFDRHGEPVAGASPEWRLVSGSVASTVVSISASSGIAQATVTLDEGGAAGLTPVFLWPYQPPESAQQTAAERRATHHDRRIGAIAGRVVIDPERLAVTQTRLLSPDAIEMARERAAQHPGRPRR